MQLHQHRLVNILDLCLDIGESLCMICLISKNENKSNFFCNTVTARTVFLSFQRPSITIPSLPCTVQTLMCLPSQSWLPNVSAILFTYN